MSGRSGRKRRLTEEEGRQLREKYLYGQAILEEARKYSPKALAAEYNIAPATIYDYVEERHKGDQGYESPRTGIREVVAMAKPTAVLAALRNLEAERSR